MSLNVVDEPKVNIDEVKYYADYDKRKKNRRLSEAIIFIIIIIILLLLLICYKIAYVGFNSLEAWEISKIELTDECMEIANVTKLHVFDDLKNGKLAPNSSGTYRFSVKNKSDNDMIYNIKFEDNMKNYINMKYRLKIDNIYIKGDANTYISLDDLSLENIMVPKNSVNIYTLEWCWEDDDLNDTKVGILKENQDYTLKMQIVSNIYKQ